MIAPILVPVQWGFPDPFVYFVKYTIYYVVGA
jgi:hypothetical protein